MRRQSKKLKTNTDQKGHSINLKIPCHRTPFYAACETGNIECAKWLIEIGGTSDIRKPSITTTPMAAACERGEATISLKMAYQYLWIRRSSTSNYKR